MKRNYRSAKFAEYLCTYAMLNRVGLHPTLMIEKRNPHRGFGLYVRDACDAGTTLLVVPSSTVLTSQTLFERGIPVMVDDGSTTVDHAPSFPLITKLLYGLGPSHWIPLALRVSLELCARHSPWWGWISSVPTLKNIKEQEASCRSKNSVSRPDLLGPYTLLCDALHSEMSASYSVACDVASLKPPKDMFMWAMYLMLSRAIIIPISSVDEREASVASCDVNGKGETDDGGEAVELAIVPFVDLCNCPSDTATGEERANADVEFLMMADGDMHFADAPSWYTEREEMSTQPLSTTDADSRRRGGVSISSEFFLPHQQSSRMLTLLTLTEPLLAGQEVLLPYATCSGAGSSTEGEKKDNQLLSGVSFPIRSSDNDALVRCLRYQIPLNNARRSRQ